MAFFKNSTPGFKHFSVHLLSFATCFSFPRTQKQSLPSGVEFLERTMSWSSPRTRLWVSSTSLCISSAFCRLFFFRSTPAKSFIWSEVLKEAMTWLFSRTPLLVSSTSLCISSALRLVFLFQEHKSKAFHLESSSWRGP